MKRVIQIFVAILLIIASCKPSADNSIAVLPFVDMSPQKDQEYLCEGITSEIITALAQIEGLKVISRASVIAFKDKQEDILDIGKKLGVEVLLEGSIQKDGNILRINTQLIKVADGSHLWSEQFNRDPGDISDIGNVISLTVADILKVEP